MTNISFLAVATRRLQLFAGPLTERDGVTLGTASAIFAQARLRVFYFDVGVVPALMTISDAMDKDTPAKLFSE